MVGLQLQILDGAGHRVPSSLCLFDYNADFCPVHLIGQCTAHHLQRPLYHRKVNLHQFTFYPVDLLQHARQDFVPLFSEMFTAHKAKSCL